MFTPGLSTSRFEGPSLIAPLSPHASPRTLLLLSLYWCVNIVLDRSEEHTSELQSHLNLVCRLLLGKKKHTTELQSHLNLVSRLLLEKHKAISAYVLTGEAAVSPSLGYKHHTLSTKQFSSLQRVL